MHRSPTAQAAGTPPRPRQAGGRQIADSNYYVWGDAGETPRVDETEYKRTAKPGDGFHQPLRDAQGNRGARDGAAGVAGALVALPDGLMVASQFPPDFNADTLAAFLPQIFDRVSQSTKELRMGELNNLNFTVGNVPWKIFRVNAVYFAAFGRAGEALPAAQLAALAARTRPQKHNNLMAIINQATKELQVKIVYYGPAMGGKTTNLVQVHDHVQTAAGNKGKLVSLATSSDRTLFFDFLPIEAMTIKGFKTKFQLYTVPGQVIYNTTRQLVLRGVDGIVFVADSQYEKMPENVESFQNLVDNLTFAQAQPRGNPLRAAIQQARPAQRRAGGIHGISAEQPRSAGAVVHRHRAQVRGRVRNAEHDHAPAAAQIHQPKRSAVRMTWPPCPNLSRRTSSSSTTRCVSSSPAPTPPPR